jgi:hypothetical protein
LDSYSTETDVFRESYEWMARDKPSGKQKSRLSKNVMRKTVSGEDGRNTQVYQVLLRRKLKLLVYSTQ